MTSRPTHEPALLDRIREACAQVARAAEQVRIQTDLIPLYSASLPPPVSEPGPWPEPAAASAGSGDRERLAAYWLTLDAVNFGSGWFPTLRKRPGRSGYHTVAEGLRRRFERYGPWAATELEQIGAPEIAGVLGQDPEHELMELFAASLRDLGSHVRRDYGGSYLGPVEGAEGSALRLVETLAGWSSFADFSAYGEIEVPFLKRAQITAADLDRAGAARLAGVSRLTMFADNLVPHVLRLDGILVLAPKLLRRIDSEELIVHGSPEEVEIRACALHAVELIVAASPVPVSAAEVDQLLWHRGQLSNYKAYPRHRARCTAY